MDVLTRVPVREQEPAVRAANFEEVCLGYNEEEAVEIREKRNLLREKRREKRHQ